VTQRGNRRERIVFSDDDYARYLRLLASPYRKQGVACWAATALNRVTEKYTQPIEKTRSRPGLTSPRSGQMNCGSAPAA
jgi:hypothetical protein